MIKDFSKTFQLPREILLNENILTPGNLPFGKIKKAAANKSEKRRCPPSK